MTQGDTKPKPLYYLSLLTVVEKAGQNKVRFTIGENLLLDSEQRKVWLDDEIIELPERSYALLLCLIEQAPNIVSHDTLIETVWPGRIVGDENLKQRVSRLRKSLGNADYILAERGLGYRLTAPVVVEPVQTQAADEMPHQTSDPILPETPQRHRSKVKWLAAGATAVLMFMAAFTLYQPQQQPDGKLGEFTARDYHQQATDYYYRFKPADNKTAITLYKKATNTDPDFAPAYSGLGNAYAQGYFQYGQEEDWLTQSVQYSNQSIELEPEQPYGYKSLGLAHHLAGRFDAAINAYNKASELGPWWVSPINNRAFVYLEAGQLQLAHQDALKAIEMDLKDPIPYLFIGLVYSRLGMQAHALKSINHAVDLKPDYLLAKNYLAQFYLDSAEPDKAQPLLLELLEQHPGNQFAHWLLSQLYLQQNQLPKAEQHFAQAAAVGGRYQKPALVHLALLQQNDSELQRLHQQLSQTLKDGMQWPEIDFNKALIELGRGQLEQGLSSLRKAINKGWLQPRRLKYTPWLKPLRDQPTFTLLSAQLDEIVTKQRQTLKSKE